MYAVDLRAREEEFSNYFVARASMLRRTAFVIVSDWHTAEDVTQRAFLKLYGAWPRISVGGRDAYARRVVVNEALSLLRKRRREVPVGELADGPRASTGELPGPPVDLSLDVLRAVRRLAPAQRAVVALRFLDDLSVRETAEILGISEGTVKSHTSRALDALRIHLPDLTAPAAGVRGEGR